VKSTTQIFGLFGDQKYSDSVSGIWFIHESRNVTNSKLDWAVGFTARYARRNRKTVHLGVKLRKPSSTVADLLNNHEGRYTRDEHGLGLDRTGSGLKPILAGSGLDRTEKIFVVLM